MEKRIVQYSKDFDVDIKNFIQCIYVGEYNLDIGIEHLKNEDVYVEYLKNGGNFWIALDENNNIIGTIAGKIVNKETLEVKRMYVKKEYRSFGIAQDLFDILEKFAIENGYKYLVLGTYKRMERAIGFYMKNSFEPDNVESKYEEETFFKKCLA